MLFSYYNESYKVLDYTYLSEYKLGGGNFATVKMEENLSPFRTTSIDKEKTKVYKKMHQEYLERFRIALNNISESEIKSLDVLKKELVINKRKYLGYGENEKYGFMDTTGTASGYHSEKLKKKSFLELIEKNEAMLVWYLGKGANIILDECVKKLINKIGFFSEEIYIFKSQNISNFYTFSVLLFHDKKIIATGVSIDGDSQKALLNALLEAKLLEAAFIDSITSPYRDFSEEDFYVIYNMVKDLSQGMPKCYMKDETQKEFILASWINTVEFAILNTKPFQEYITVRCFSKDLLNAIPTKNNILSNRDKKIFKVFGFTEESIQEKPDCIIV